MIHIKPTIDAKHFVTTRKWQQAMKKANGQVAEHWHGKILAKHFYKDAATKYQHAPRSRGYLKRKRGLASRGVMKSGEHVQRGGQIDNVFTGNMEKMLKRVGVIRSFPTRSTLTMTGPTYITMNSFAGDRALAVAKGWTYGKGKKFNARAGKQPDKIREVTATTPQEREELAKVADTSLERSAAGW